MSADKVIQVRLCCNIPHHISRSNYYGHRFIAAPAPMHQAPVESRAGCGQHVLIERSLVLTVQLGKLGVTCSPIRPVIRVCLVSVFVDDLNIAVLGLVCGGRSGGLPPQRLTVGLVLRGQDKVRVILPELYVGGVGRPPRAFLRTPLSHGRLFEITVLQLIGVGHPVGLRGERPFCTIRISIGGGHIVPVLAALVHSHVDAVFRSVLSIQRIARHLRALLKWGGTAVVLRSVPAVGDFSICRDTRYVTVQHRNQAAVPVDLIFNGQRTGGDRFLNRKRGLSTMPPPPVSISVLNGYTSRLIHGDLPMFIVGRPPSTGVCIRQRLNCYAVSTRSDVPLISILFLGSYLNYIADLERHAI